MFLNLQQGSPIYILDKSNELTYSEGTIERTTLPQTKFGTYVPVMDLIVNINGSQKEFRQVPANSNFADGGPDGTFITDSKDEMLKHLNNYSKVISDTLTKVPVYQKNLTISDEIRSRLSPEYAKEVTRDKDIDSLKKEFNNMQNKFNNVDDKLNNILGLLSKSETIKN